MRIIKSGISLLLLFAFVCVQSVPVSLTENMRTQALSPLLGASSQTAGTSSSVKAAPTASPVLVSEQYSKTQELRAVNEKNDRVAKVTGLIRLIGGGLVAAAGTVAGFRIFNNLPQIQATFEKIQLWALGIKGTIYEEVFAGATEEAAKGMQANIAIVAGFFGLIAMVMVILVVKRIVSSIIVISREKIKVTRFDRKMFIGYAVRVAVLSVSIALLVPAFPGLWAAYLGAGSAVSSYMITVLGSPASTAMLITIVQKVLAGGLGFFALRVVLLSLFPNWKLDGTLKDFRIELLPVKQMVKVLVRYVIAIALVIGAFSLPVLLQPVIPAAVQAMGQYSMIAGAFVAVFLFISLLEWIEVGAKVNKKYGNDLEQNPQGGIYTYLRPGEKEPEYFEGFKKAKASITEAQMMTGVEKILSFGLGAGYIAPETVGGKVTAVPGVRAGQVDAVIHALEGDARLFISNRLYTHRIRVKREDTLKALVAGMLIVQWKECPEIFGATPEERAANITRVFAEIYSSPIITDSDAAYGFAKEGQFLKLIHTPVRSRLNAPIFVAALYHRILERNMGSFLGNIPEAARSAERARYEQYQVFKFVDALPIKTTYMQGQFDDIFGEQSYENTQKTDAAIFTGFFTAFMSRVRAGTAMPRVVGTDKQAGIILSAA